MRVHKQSLHESLQLMPSDVQCRVFLNGVSLKDSQENSETNKRNGENACVVCQAELDVMAAVPCGHVCVCRACSDLIIGGAGSRQCHMSRGFTCVHKETTHMMSQSCPEEPFWGNVEMKLMSQNNNSHRRVALRNFSILSFSFTSECQVENMTEHTYW